MLTSTINFKNFKKKNKLIEIRVKNKLNSLLNEKNFILNSLKKSYKNSYSKKKLAKYKKINNFKVIGMGGSTLGTQTIYDFFRKKIKKNFIFIDNLNQKKIKIRGNKNLNLVVSKSGNTIETIVNSNIYIKRGDKNIFIMHTVN